MGFGLVWFHKVFAPRNKQLKYQVSQEMTHSFVKLYLHRVERLLGGEGETVKQNGSVWATECIEIQRKREKETEREEVLLLFFEWDRSGGASASGFLMPTACEWALNGTASCSWQHINIQKRKGAKGSNQQHTLTMYETAGPESLSRNKSLSAVEI